MRSLILSSLALVSLSTLTHAHPQQAIQRRAASGTPSASAAGSLKTPEAELKEDKETYNSTDATVLLPILAEIDATNDIEYNASYNNQLLSGDGVAGTNLGKPTPPDNCYGSHYCGWNPWFSMGATHQDCENAYGRFEPRNRFERHAARTYGHCTAIFDCWPPQAWDGWQIQKQFDEIRNNNCQICGSHYFQKEDKPINSCRVTLNYCWHCVDVDKGWEDGLTGQFNISSNGNTAGLNSVAAAAQDVTFS